MSPDAEVLPPALSERLLSRASELDAALRAGATVAQLRSAAMEAGISAEAFDAALAEVQGNVATQVARPRRSTLRARVHVAALVLFAGAMLLVSRLVIPTPAGAGLVEESISLQCLSPGDAAELARPLLGPSGTIRIAPERAPHVITIRATPEQMQQVRSSLAQRETACPAP